MLVVIGGQCRKVGKTSVLTGLIRATPQARWTAVKISHHALQGCAPTGNRPGCLLVEETALTHTDSGRYLEAGAVRSYWLRTRPGGLREAVSALRPILEAGPNSILESDGIVEFLDPDLYLVVLDFSLDNVKQTTLRHLRRADACVVIARAGALPVTEHLLGMTLEAKPRYPVTPPGFFSRELADFVRGRLTA